MKIEKTLTIVLLIALFFSGCKKDKNEASYSSYVTYNGTKYPIEKGVLENYGLVDVGGAYIMSVTLFSSSFTLLEVDGEITGVSGKGHLLRLWMYSSSLTQLDNGTYNFAYSGAPGTFDYGWIDINYDSSLDYADIDQDIAGGTVTISVTGDVYEITLNCTDEDGKSVTGYFKGTLKFYNYISKKSTKDVKSKF